MRHRALLEERLGPLVLAKLFELVADGSIERGSLKRMSFSHNMDVVETYLQCDRDKESLERTLERMLEEVIRDIKSVASSSSYGDRSRYKRDVKQLDQEIAELQVVLGQSSPYHC